jgi:hypothetical protein
MDQARIDVSRRQNSPKMVSNWSLFPSSSYIFGFSKPVAVTGAGRSAYMSPRRILPEDNKDANGPQVLGSPGVLDVVIKMETACNMLGTARRECSGTQAQSHSVIPAEFFGLIVLGYGTAVMRISRPPRSVRPRS